MYHHSSLKTSIEINTTTTVTITTTTTIKGKKYYLSFLGRWSRTNRVVVVNGIAVVVVVYAAVIVDVGVVVVIDGIDTFALGILFLLFEW